MQFMPKPRHTTGLLVVILLAVIGYLLVTLPPKLIEQYGTAKELGQWVGYGYIAVVGTGGLILLGLLVWFLARVWRNSRRKAASDERRNLNPSEMSAAERSRELADNLATGKEFAGGEIVSPKLRAEIEAANPITLSQYLRRIPVIRIRESLGLAQAVSSRGPRTELIDGAVMAVPCVMRIALDGQLQPEDVGLNIVAPGEIGGIEIYPGPSTIPAEFAAWSNEIGCGLIVVWTRRR